MKNKNIMDWAIIALLLLIAVRLFKMNEPAVSVPPTKVNDNSTPSKPSKKVNIPPTLTPPSSDTEESEVSSVSETPTKEVIPNPTFPFKPYEVTSYVVFSDHMHSKYRVFNGFLSVYRVVVDSYHFGYIFFNSFYSRAIMPIRKNGILLAEVPPNCAVYCPGDGFVFKDEKNMEFLLSKGKAIYAKV